MSKFEIDDIGRPRILQPDNFTGFDASKNPVQQAVQNGAFAHTIYTFGDDTRMVVPDGDPMPEGLPGHVTVAFYRQDQVITQWTRVNGKLAQVVHTHERGVIVDDRGLPVKLKL